jgi:PAS domain S-box-containing protein
MKLRGKVIATGMVGAIVLIAISTLLLNHNYRLLEANADSVEKAYQVNEALDRSYASMLSLAADSRYFVITGDSAYFENMNSDSTLIRKELAHLQELLQKEKVEIVTLEKDYFALIESKLQFDHYVLITRLKHGFADAQKLIATGQGKKLLNRILEQRNLLTQAINMELAEREKRLHDQIAANETVAVIGFALSIASLTLLSYALYRKMNVAQALNRVVKEKERELSVILASITEGVIATDSQGYISYMNPVAEELTGWNWDWPGALHFENVYRIKDESSGAGLPSPVKTIIQTGLQMPMSNSTMLITRDNTERNINQNGAPIRDEKGKITGAVITFRDITEKVKSERKLANSQKRFNVAFFSNPSPMLISSAQHGLIMDVNESFLSLMGYSSDEVIGKTYKELSLYDAEQKQKMAEKVKRNGYLSNEEVVLQSKSGKLKPVLASVTPVDLDDEKCLLITLTDMTNWREAELRYQSIFMNTHEGIYQSTPGGRFLAANPAMAEMFGYSSPQDLIESVTDIGRQLYMNSLFRLEVEMMLAKTGQVKGLELQTVKKNKEVIWIRANIHEVRDLAGQLQYYEGTVEDITDRKKAEEKLMQLSMAVEQSSASIVITDTTGAIQYVNRKFTEVSGYTYQEVEGRNPSILKSGLTAPEEYKALWRSITAGKEWRGEFQNKKKNGELFWESALVSPILNANGVITHFLAVKEDITERKIAEQILDRQNKELQKTNYELDRFVYSTSHDLRAPLASILGLLGLCEKEPLTPVLNTRLQMIRSSVLRMDGFIRDILDYSRNNRNEVLSMQISFEELLREAQKDLEFMKGKDRIKIHTEINQSAPFFSDVVRVESILRNLLSNAIKYQDTTKENSRAEFRVVINSGTATIDYHDNGIGIHPQYLDKIGTMFFRASPYSQGSGLGLYITKETIHRLGGTFAIESEPGHYTKIKITLPNRKESI